MSLPVILRAAAEADIEEAYSWLEDAQRGIGEAFVGNLRDVFQRMEAAPESCGVVWRDVRAVRVRKFCYVVYYVAFTDRVEVLGVIHGSRHESAWRSRV